MPRRRLLIVLGLMLFLASPASAAMLIDVYSVKYSTSIELTTNETNYYDPILGSEIVTMDVFSRTTTSLTDPVQDSYAVDNADVSAYSGLFTVSAWTNDMDVFQSGTGVALARTDLFFSPTVDGFTSIGLNFVGEDQFEWSEGLVRLYDITTGSELFKYSWEMETMAGNVPWNQARDTGVVSLDRDVTLLASHSYLFTLSSLTGSDGDSQRMTISATGLKTAAVPEPATALLLGIGAALCGFARRRPAQRTLTPALGSSPYASCRLEQSRY